MYLLINTAIKNQTTAALVNHSGEIFKKRTIKYQGSGANKLLPLIDEVLSSLEVKFAKLEGVLTVVGPGDFSAVREGVVAANTAAFVLHILLAGIKLKEGQSFAEIIKRGLLKIKKAKTGIVSPVYGKEPNITEPKKFIPAKVR